MEDRIEDDEIKLRLGEAMRRRREELGVSQERAALMCGLARSYYAETERGRRNIAVVNIRRIAEGLELTAAELLERAGL